MFNKFITTVYTFTLKAFHLVEKFLYSIFGYHYSSSWEFVVTGKNELMYQLDNVPHATHVFFKDECVITPCSPNQTDYLDWELSHDGVYWYLIVKWEVTNARAVVCDVCY